MLDMRGYFLDFELKLLALAGELKVLLVEGDVGVAHHLLLGSVGP